MKLKFISLIQKASFVLSYLMKNSFSESKFLKSIITDEAVVVDIGSNKKTHVYSIEPNKELIKFQKNKFRNRENIKFYNFAIDTKNGIRILYVRNPASHSSFFKTHQEEKFNKIVETVEVQTCTLEKFFVDQKITKITLLKIDIEGQDYEVFRSAKDLFLNNKIDYIKIEANQDSFKKIMEFAFDSNLKFLGVSKSFYFENKYNFMDIYFQNTN
jgi:FkbM family methyltransferase